MSGDRKLRALLKLREASQLVRVTLAREARLGETSRRENLIYLTPWILRLRSDRPYVTRTKLFNFRRRPTAQVLTRDYKLGSECAL